MVMTIILIAHVTIINNWSIIIIDCESISCVNSIIIKKIIIINLTHIIAASVLPITRIIIVMIGIIWIKNDSCTLSNIIHIAL